MRAPRGIWSALEVMEGESLLPRRTAYDEKLYPGRLKGVVSPNRRICSAMHIFPTLMTTWKAVIVTPAHTGKVGGKGFGVSLL